MDLRYVDRLKTNPSNLGLRHLDPDTDLKVRQIMLNVNEVAHLAANEPSMGLFRIQEHVHRTIPKVVQRKIELKKNLEAIEGATYDLGLSIDVVDSISTIQHFTRIQEALKTATEIKRKLNIREEQENARRELDSKHAAQANRSLSQNEPAEGYICPVCYFALRSQDELISHWQNEHSLDKYDNDVFEDVSLQSDADINVTAVVEELGVDNENNDDLSIIEVPADKYTTVIDSAAYVVKSYDDETDILGEEDDDLLKTSKPEDSETVQDIEKSREDLTSGKTCNNHATIENESIVVSTIPAEIHKS